MGLVEGRCERRVYVRVRVYGLLACQKAGIAVPDDELTRGLQFLQKQYLEETDLHQMAYQARVLALVPRCARLLRSV